MTVMESKTTSKTSCLKALLLRAWRERWSDLQWGVNIKTVLPRGVSGDVYNLADCILQQALVGSGANQLVLSYLKHSLSAQLVSHAAVLQRLSKFSQLHKTHCVLGLLEFLEGMLPGVTCCGKSDETKLANAILATTYWLLQVLQHCQAPGAVAGGVSVTQLIEKAIAVLKMVMTSQFCLAMMCLARYNDKELYAELRQKCCELETGYAGKEEILESVHELLKLDVTSLSPHWINNEGPGCLIQAWLGIHLVGKPDSPTKELAERLNLLGRLKCYSDSRLYCEIIRGSFLVLCDVGQTNHESQWGAFAFLKVPRVLVNLTAEFSEKPSIASTSVVNAIEMLLKNPSLLERMDANSSCSSLECLLGELVKCQLISDVQSRHLCDLRGTITPAPKLDGSISATTAGIPKVIICAEPTLAGILKTLSTDYHKIQDALLGMLHQVLSGKSFELILAVAAVQGQLRTLVSRLIRFNECSKLFQGNDKAKAQLFDISFLMLVAIVQNYGADAVLDPEGDSLFERWVRTCMIEVNKPKAPDGPLKLCNDPAYVDTLLQQFNAGEADFKQPVKWQDVLFNMPGVMKEVLVAWEQGALMAADVKRILDAIRGRMCCLPLAAAAWLCAYMRTAPHDTLLKPVNMVQQLLAPLPDDENRERWQLTCEIIQKMQRDVQLMLRPKNAKQLVSKQPACDQLHSIWQSAISRGWLDHKSAGIVHTLLDTAGPRWLVSAVVHELLLLRHRVELNRGVDLALALFHTNICGCTLHLLTDSLPQLLLCNVQNNSGDVHQVVGDLSSISGNMQQQLMEPQLSALAKLTAYCVYAAIATSSNSSTNEDADEHPQIKIRRPNTSTGFSSIHWSSTSDEKAPLTTLRQLFASLELGMQDGSITQQMYFSFQLLKSLVEVRPPTSSNENSNAFSSSVLTAVPPALVSQLLRTLPESFTPQLLLQVHDLHSPSGRSNAAKDLCILRNFELKKAPVSTVTNNNIITHAISNGTPVSGISAPLPLTQQ